MRKYYPNFDTKIKRRQEESLQALRKQAKKKKK